MRRKTFTPVLAVALVTAVVLAMVRPWDGNDDAAAADEPELYARAIALIENGGGEAAATVNGEPIPLAKVKAYNLFLQQGHGPMSAEQELPYATTREYLDMLIDNELLYQEATRRGLVPSDAEVREYTLQMKDGLTTVIAEESEAGKELGRTMQSVEGTSFDLATFESNPIILDGVRFMMAIGALHTQIIDAALPDQHDRSRDAMEAAVQEVVNQLRAVATIEVLVQP